MNSAISFCRTRGPLGDMLVAAAGSALTGIWFADQKYVPSVPASWREDPVHPVLREALAQLAQYFAGARSAFDLPLAPEGTPFQQAVWRAIAAVPFGATSTYGELAAQAGQAQAARAAGAATGRNPLSIVIPCHRIVGRGGALTGYAGGLDRKRALLALERTTLETSGTARRAA